MASQPTTSSQLIGRDPELAIVMERIERLAGGTGSTILLSGEAGIGKSRLVGEAIARISVWPTNGRAAPLILRGYCFETDRTLPYAPFLDLLRGHVASRSPAQMATAFGRDAPAFARLMPELAYVLPGIPAEVKLDAEQEKRQTFRSLLDFFTRLSEAGPVLLILEDLHWSDDVSLEFLPHLARRTTSHPLLLLLTYRSEEVGASLHHALANLDRERLALELPLRRLTIGEVDRLLRGIFQQPQAIRLDFLQALFGLTDGNPFFVEEVVQGLIAQGDIFLSGDRWSRKELGELRLPRSIRDAVRRRTASLSQPAIQVLHVAAVAGQFFDFTVLQAVTGLGEPALLGLIRELLAARLVVEESADRFAFRHALTRQAVYGDLLLRERRSLHRAIGAAVEQLAGQVIEPRLSELAYHFEAAEEWEKAFAYARLAGERDLRLHAPRSAIEQFNRVVSAAEQLGRPAPPDIYRQRGRAHSLLGEFDAARADYEHLLALARASGDQAAEWQSLIDLGELWSGIDYAATGDHFRAALQLARTAGNQLALALSLTQLGGWHLNVEQPVQARDVLRQALAIFETTGDQAGIARTLDLLGMVEDIAGNIPRMSRYLEQALPLFEALDHRTGQASCLATLALQPGAYPFDTVVVEAGIPVERAVRNGERALQMAREAEWRSGEAYALGCLGLMLGPHGELGRALECGRQSLAIATEIEHREWTAIAHFCLGFTFRDVLDAEAERTQLELALRSGMETGSSLWENLTIGCLASCCIGHGGLARAESLLGAPPATLPMETIGQRRLWTSRAELELASSRPAAALEIVDGLFATAANLTGFGDIPLLAQLRGLALAALGRTDEAEALLRQAIEGAAERGLRVSQWQSHRALGLLYRQQSRSAEAEQELRRGWEIIEAMAATLAEQTRNRFVERAAELFPRASAQRARDAAPRLTARERDVATLITRGMSNREIADALFVGERTIETHVSNILAKLGFATRAQVAAWAVASGLSNADEPAR